jgi:serine phosphatase RsbU (regulator of sigma subunit)/ABC-type transporter Mla MlaB component
MQRLTSFDLVDLLQTGSDVQTTVYEFGDATIRRSTKDDQTILSISGVYSRTIAKEIERLALQCRGNLGVEFKDIRPNPGTAKGFDSSVLGLLKSLRERFQARGKLFFLCSPPQDLRDLLTLTGTIESLQVLDAADTAAPLCQGPAAPGGRKGKAPIPPPHQELVQKRIVNLNQSLKRTASLERGLDSAQRCIERFLPQVPPEIAGYSFAFSYQSSEKVGGDFFDFIPLSDGSLGIVIGDVSGHGLDAALIMGISKKVLSIRAQEVGNGSPLEVLLRANRDLVPDFKRNSFVTVLYGILDPPTGRFTFARAGHEHPILFGAGSGCTTVQSRGVPLGTDLGGRAPHLFEEKTVEIPPGGYLFLSTDGLAESRNDRGTIFSRNRLLFLLSQIALAPSARTVLDRVVQSVKEYCGTRAHEDDVTTILLHRMGKRET